MKKTVSAPLIAALIAIVILASFAGCARGRSASDVLDSICAALSESGGGLPPSKYIYKNGAVSGTRSYLAPELAGLLYYGNKTANVRELNLLSDYAIRLPDDLSVYEIHVMRAKNPADRDKIAEMLDSRLRMLQSADVYLYVPDAYEACITSGEVIVKGNFVILLITPDNKSAKGGI